MKQLSPEFREHIEQEATTLCRCWIMELGNGDKLGFTDHDQDLIVNGTVCERSAGAESSGIEERLGLSVDSAQISGALRSDTISTADIAAGKYDNARITTYIVNWSQPDLFSIDQVMMIGEISEEDGIYRFELRGISSSLDQTKGRQFIRRCQADLGDNRCGIDLSNGLYSAEGTVLETRSAFDLTASGLDEFENGWFTFGALEWISGENSGSRIEVASHIRSENSVTVTLWSPMAAVVLPGDQFTITAGCNKQFETCRAKFLNPANFQGFPHMPGDEVSLTHAGNQTEFDGGPIVP
ncbi:MAG: DUF2163 domain-containing protein [Pseudomonadota bacterium]